MSDSVRIRLVFVDEGEYHREEVTVPAAAMDEYDRLIDFLREDAKALRHLHMDLERLCAAYRVDGSDRGASSEPSNDSAVAGSGSSILPFSTTG